MFGATPTSSLYERHPKPVGPWTSPHRDLPRGFILSAAEQQGGSSGFPLRIISVSGEPYYLHEGGRVGIKSREGENDAVFERRTFLARSTKQLEPPPVPILAMSVPPVA